jgi:hypothetical protein
MSLESSKRCCLMSLSKTVQKPGKQRFNSPFCGEFPPRETSSRMTYALHLRLPSNVPAIGRRQAREFKPRLSGRSKIEGEHDAGSVRRA